MDTQPAESEGPGFKEFAEKVTGMPLIEIREDGEWTVLVFANGMELQTIGPCVYVHEDPDRIN